MSNLKRISRQQRSRFVAHPVQPQLIMSPPSSNRLSPLPPPTPTNSSSNFHLSPVSARDYALPSVTCSVSQPVSRVRAASEREPIVSRQSSAMIGPYPTFVPIRHNSLPSNCMMDSRELEVGSRNCRSSSPAVPYSCLDLPVTHVSKPQTPGVKSPRSQ